MGFSVSGSAAIVFAGMFLSFGIFYAASSNSFERVSSAEESQAGALLDEHNTDIEITSTTYSGTRLTVLVNNTGTTELSVNDTDFLVENTYISDWEPDARIVGDGDDGPDSTELWLPGEQLNITIRTEDVPARAKVVTDSGVADASEVA